MVRSFKWMRLLLVAGAVVAAASQAMAVVDLDYRQVPEIDPSALQGVLTLIGGGLCVVADRLRRS